MQQPSPQKTGPRLTTAASSTQRTSGRRLRAPLLSLHLVRSPIVIAGCCLLLLFSAGCRGSEESLLRPYDGTRVLPSTRDIAHPDSLHGVELVQTPDSVALTLKRPYAELTREWSAQIERGVDDVALRPGMFNSYATLQSLELQLINLKREGIFSLSSERAVEQVNETIASHQETLTFAINVFVDARSVGTPYSLLRQNISAELEVDGTVVSAARSSQLPVDQIQRSGDTIYHYRIIARFPRTKDGEDLLDDARSLRLSTLPFHSTTRLTFEWRLRDDRA